MYRGNLLEVYQSRKGTKVKDMHMFTVNCSQCNYDFSHVRYNLFYTNFINCKSIISALDTLNVNNKYHLVNIELSERIIEL